MSDKAQRIAEEIERAHRNGETFANLSGSLQPDDIAQAYAAQQALQGLRAEGPRGAVAGRKIALASRVQQELCGIDHPIAGAIYANEIHSSPARLQSGDFHGLGIEYEIALTLSEDTKPGREYKREELSALIASAHPAFEMIIDRGADYSNIDVATMIADNAWCAGIVLGDDFLGSLGEDAIGRLADLPVTLHWNDETETSSTASTDPVAALTWIVNLLSGMGEVLEAGQPVITGSVMQTRYPVAGDKVRLTVDDHAAIELLIQ